MMVSVFLNNGDTINYFEVKKTKEKRGELKIKYIEGLEKYKMSDIKGYLISK